MDEADLIGRAIAFSRTSIPLSPLDAVFPDLFPKSWIANPFFFTIQQSLVLRWFTVPNLLAARALSLFWGGVLLLANYWIARRLGGRNLGLISTLLIALSIAFSYAAHTARYDTFPAALAWLAIAALLYSWPTAFWSGAAAGLLVCLAIETHPNSLIFVPIAVAVVWLEGGRATLRRPQFWGLALGGITGAAIYAAIHILPDPKTFFAANMVVNAVTKRPPILTGSIQILAKSLINTARLTLVPASSLIPLAIIQIIRCLRKPSKEGTQILVMTGVMLVSVALIWPDKTGYYGLMIAPPLLWLAGAFILDFVRQPWRRSLAGYASQVLVWGMVLGGIALAVAPLFQNNYPTFEKAQAQVDQVVQPGETVMGMQTYWFSLYDHPYLRWEYLFLYPRVYPGKTMEDAFAYYHPDIFIIDQSMQTRLSDTADPEVDPAYYFYHVPRTEFFNYLDQHAKLVASFDNDIYGPIQIYRFNWSKYAQAQSQ